jgi:hypothetical protein
VLVLVVSKPDTVLASKLLVSKPDTVLAIEAGARWARKAREVTSTGAEAPVEVKEAVEEAPADSTLSLGMQACRPEDAEEVGGGGLDPFILEAPGAAGADSGGHGGRGGNRGQSSWTWRGHHRNAGGY